MSEEIIADFCRRHGIRKLSFFGSIIRSDFRPDSDIEVLVEFLSGERVGLRFFALQDELTEILGRRVDLHTVGFLSKYFREEVQREARVQYVAA